MTISHFQQATLVISTNSTALKFGLTLDSASYNTEQLQLQLAVHIYCHTPRFELENYCMVNIQISFSNRNLFLIVW